MSTETNRCPICTSTEKNHAILDGRIYYDCPRCGEYEITDNAVNLFHYNNLDTKLLSLSYWIRKHQSVDYTPYIDTDIMKKLLIPFEPLKPNEQANNLLLWVGDNVGKPDGLASESPSNLISMIGAIDESNVLYVLDYLKQQGYITHNIAEIQMTFKGWERYDELKKLTKDSKLVFMAMQYGNSVLDKIFNDAIKVAVAMTGFEIRKLDEVKRPGLIDDKLRIEIRRSKFLIADLTDDNNGAYWEAGYAEGLGMPVIYICEEDKFKEKKTHFDTNHHLTIQWKDDPDSLNKFAEELKATIREAFPAEAKMDD
jgi:hypothetical protein